VIIGRLPKKLFDDVGFAFWFIVRCSSFSVSLSLRMQDVFPLMAISFFPQLTLTSLFSSRAFRAASRRIK